MPVVGTENDNGALVQAQLAHLVHDGSDLPVQLVHHGSVFFCRSGAFPVGSAGIAIGLADGRGARVRVFFWRNIYRAVGKVGGKKKINMGLFRFSSMKRRVSSSITSGA